jgi:hypothetical protein
MGVEDSLRPSFRNSHDAESDAGHSCSRSQICMNVMTCASAGAANRIGNRRHADATIENESPRVNFIGSGL